MTADGSPLPSGVVTFVFTDIEGSTRLLRRLGDGYVEVLDRHQKLLRRAWAAHGGHEINTEGDSFFVAFDRVGDATRACARGQRALQSQRWPEGVRVRVRMGVHVGLAAPVGSEYIALAVHQAARVSAVAHGGQVVLSEQAAGEEGARDVGLAALGRYRVRDFERPVRLFQLVGPGLRTMFPAVRAVPADQHNLAVPLTRLIGRDRDAAALEAALTEHRLLTVVGTGGVGKSRLATEVGLRVAASWPSGVWLVDCSPLEDSALLPAAIASVLGIAAEGTTTAWTDVLNHLREARTLLILDGCERHADAVAALVSALLDACPKVGVLATSREPLHLPAEARWNLSPLPTQGIDSAAVELFAERARAVRHDFRLTDEVAPVVLTLCRRLDGLPLALEIAAARMTVLEPAEILAGLDRRFELLRLRDRTRPPRQQALEALLDWSVRLLSNAETTALRRLALLAGDFDLETATNAVANGEVGAESVPELIWSLVDRSLLVADPIAGATRYRSLETVRTYARDLLERYGEVAARAGRLAAFYAERLGPGRRTDRTWVTAVAADLDNLRPLIPLAADEAEEHAQELACTIARYHDAVQSFRTGITEVTRLVRELTGPTQARVGLLTALGDLHVRVGEAATAERFARKAETLRARVGAPGWDEVGVEKLLGEVAISRQQPDRAVAIAEVALRRRLSPRARARMSNLLGIALATLGRSERAAAAFRSELQAARQLGDDVLLAHAHGNSAEIAFRLGDDRAGRPPPAGLPEAGHCARPDGHGRLHPLHHRPDGRSGRSGRATGLGGRRPAHREGRGAAGGDRPRALPDRPPDGAESCTLPPAPGSVQRPAPPRTSPAERSIWTLRSPLPTGSWNAMLLAASHGSRHAPSEEEAATCRSRSRGRTASSTRRPGSSPTGRGRCWCR